MSFTKILSGETQAFKIVENESFLAFLEPNPIVLGHTVVLPKESGGYIFEMEQESFLALHLFAKQVAIKLKKGVNCKKVGLSVIGLVEPHTHLHLIPLQKATDMNFSSPRLKLTSEELRSLYTAILKA